MSARSLDGCQDSRDNPQLSICLFDLTMDKLDMTGKVPTEPFTINMPKNAPLEKQLKLRNIFLLSAQATLRHFGTNLPPVSYCDKSKSELFFKV